MPVPYEPGVTVRPLSYQPGHHVSKGQAAVTVWPDGHVGFHAPWIPATDIPDWVSVLTVARAVAEQAQPTPADDVKYPDIHVQLTGEDGNAMVIMGAVSAALRRAGHTAEIKAFVQEATSGDYDHLLATACRWVSVS